MKQSNDDEQLVLFYGELKEMCGSYQAGHRATYVKEYTHYWHNVLKDKLTKYVIQISVIVIPYFQSIAFSYDEVNISLLSKLTN